MKQLLDPKNKTYHLQEFGIDLPIGDAIIIGDGNEDLSKFLDKATLERIAREDYNMTKPSERLNLLEKAAAKAVSEQSLTDEAKRPELRKFMDDMLPIIYNTNEAVKEQSYRPSAQVASNVAALAASALERGEQPDIERSRQQNNRYYGKFHPNLQNLISKEVEKSDEQQAESVSGKIASLGIGSSAEKLSPRVRRNLERDELSLAQDVGKANPELGDNWARYVGLNRKQKEAATQLHRARLEDISAGIPEKELIPNNEHSRLLERIPIELIGTHNLLNGISSPTPSARGTQSSSRRSSVSERDRSGDLLRSITPPGRETSGRLR
jgi:hypothetical protein